MRFSELTDYLERLEKTASRNEITEILAELFGKLSTDETQITVYMLLGSLRPSFDSLLLNIAEKMNLEAIAIAFNCELDSVKKMYKNKGDQGVVAERLSQKNMSDITISEVYLNFEIIAKLEGRDSQEKKVSALADLYRSLDSRSVRFAARLPVGKLRLGFSDKTIIDALSFFLKGDKSVKSEIEKAFEVMPDVGLLAKRIKLEGLSGLSKIKPVVGVPVMPMLAQRLKSPSEMIKKMGEVSVEPKFDGLRVLIHYEKDKLTKAFTRNLNEISSMFPELKSISKYSNADNLIIDTEAVGLDPNTKKMVDFQKTISRRRKHGISESAKGTPIRFAVFDLIFMNGKSYMGEEYGKRREILERIFKKNEVFVVDEKLITTDSDRIRERHEKYLADGLEGVIVKKLNSKYVPGRTGWRWVKMKEVESAHARLNDTVDGLIMGYTQGKGKRAEFGIGQFLAGVRVGEEYKTITKVGTGLTDEQFRELAKRLRKIEVKDKPKEYEVTKELSPDYWVLPEVVVELAADEITVSPPNKHTAGYALRFPRLIKFRDDKSKGQVTTLKELREMYKGQ